MMCVSGCGGDALRFVRGQLARGSESLTSGHLASETLLGNTGKEGHGCRSPGLPHWRTWHTHGVPCWAMKASFSESVEVLKGVSRLIWTHEWVRDLGQNPGEGGISDANKKKEGVDGPTMRSEVT